MSSPTPGPSPSTSPSPSPSTSATPSRAEAQARRLLATYPWRMRAEQGDEIVATVLDTLPAGATRLPWRTAVDLVRGGLRTRRQRRPPFLTRLAFDLRLTIHPRWIWWVFDRLEDPHYRRNDALHRMGPILVVLGAIAVLRGDWTQFWMGGLTGMAVSVLGWRLWGERQRDMLRARHGLTAGGSDPRMVWIAYERRPLLPGREPRIKVRPVYRKLLHHVPGAVLWAPEIDEGATAGARPEESRSPDGRG